MSPWPFSQISQISLFSLNAASITPYVRKGLPDGDDNNDDNDMMMEMTMTMMMLKIWI